MIYKKLFKLCCMNMCEKNLIASIYSENKLYFLVILKNGFLIRSFLPYNSYDDTLDFLFEKYPGCEISDDYVDIAEKLADVYFGRDMDLSKLPIDLNRLDLTDFQKNVLKETMKIKKSNIKTYQDIAESFNSKAYRAVGTALSNNPLALFIPCHRVVKKNMEIGGFFGGSEIKAEILGNESVEVENNKIVQV